jgi:adenosylcobinamide-GDP ribazoletransferase
MSSLGLAVGTLTALPVRPPRVVNRRVASRAMALAPLVGLLLGGIAAAIAAAADRLGLAPLGCGVLVVVLLAWTTRGLHLDGLADTADGLGGGRSAAERLTIMSRSDIGPFGVVTLLLVLLLQVAAVSQAWAAGVGVEAVLVATVASRAAIPLMCHVRVPPAKKKGLGADVAASVSTPLLVLSLVVTAAVVAALVIAGDPADLGERLAYAAAALVAALLGAVLVLRRTLPTFGGITGDVLGAGVEVAFTAALLVLAVS